MAKDEKVSAEEVVRDIRRQTRKKYSAEEKIRIVLEGLRGEDSIAELCRREGITSSMDYGWSKEFLEAGKKRSAGTLASGAGGALHRHTGLLCLGSLGVPPAQSAGSDRQPSVRRDQGNR